MIGQFAGTERFHAARMGALARRVRPHALLGTSLSVKIGGGILILYVVVALVSLVWTPHNPKTLSLGPVYGRPSAKFWLGTDQLGSDVASRLMAATRLDLIVIVLSVLLALVIGTVLGTMVGFFGRVLDTPVMRLLEVLQSFPVLILAMLINQATGPGLGNLIVIMAFVGMPEYLRLIRAEVMSRRSWPFVEAARLAGGGPVRVAFRHVMPNSMTPVFAYMSINAAWVALLAASLGFIGLGFPPGTAEWGAMISSSQDGIVTGQWWASFFPGLAVFGIAGAFYFIGDGLSGSGKVRAWRGA